MNVAEALFYLVSGSGLLAWALALVIDLAPKIHGSLQDVLFRNSGTSALVVALATLSAAAFYGAVSALRGRSLAAPSASVLLITVAALRTLQIMTAGSVHIADANFLGLLFAAAALLYYGQARVWWLILMPLAVAAAFAPLIWLEFYKGAPTTTLVQALTVPGAAFLVGNLIVVLRDLRLRAQANVSGLAIMTLRSKMTMAQLRTMESDLKSLRSILSGERADETPLSTTEFNQPLSRVVEPSETASFDEVDAAARRLLDEARGAVEGRPVKLSLTAPTSGGLPIAVRGNAPLITAWMKSAILNSIESLGGFPDGMVRVILKPGLSSLVISVEDNGRGFGETLLTKMGQAEDRIALTDIRTAVERLGGRFDIQARLGVGSRLSIELPRIDAFASSPRVAAATRVAALHDAAISPSTLH